jgi:hypothetical protein
MSVKPRWLRIGATAAFASAASALVAAVASGITGPTGILTVAAVIAAVLAYGVAPLVVTIALRQSALSTWWTVAAALLATALWLAVALLLAVPALVAPAPALIAAIIGSAPSSSALWILAASVEVVRAGMQRWSLVVVAAFVAVLMIGSVLIELSGFDIRKVLVPLGWAAWMFDLGGALRARMSPASTQPTVPRAEPCANCGAPRRADGLAFCSDCGLPYGVSKSGS